MQIPTCHAVLIIAVLGLSMLSGCTNNSDAGLPAGQVNVDYCTAPRPSDKAGQITIRILEPAFGDRHEPSKQLNFEDALLLWHDANRATNVEVDMDRHGCALFQVPQTTKGQAAACLPRDTCRQAHECYWSGAKTMVRENAPNVPYREIQLEWRYTCP